MNIYPHLSMIVAVAQNKAIGFENKLLYWLPNDLKRFKALTTGHTIIMGRRTFESLPKGALPNRRNIVLTHQEGASYVGAEVFSSLEDALNHCSEEEEVFIIGGASLYKEALPITQKLYLTLVENTPKEADAFFPEISETEWMETKRDAHPKDDKHLFSYLFIDYERRG